MNTNEYLKKTLKLHEELGGIPYEWQEIRPRLKCKDGFEISVQASEGHYSTPRKNGDIEYSAVEIGFPSSKDELIKDLLDDSGIAGWVDVGIIDKLIKKHGGIQEEK